MAEEKRITKREKFLDTMNKVVPWEEWEEIIRPYYPKGERGRPPIGIATMLRVYLVQVWFNMSDEATEDALYDSNAIRKFVGLNSDERAPDATTLLKFRHLLEENDLCEKLFQSIKKMLDDKGCIIDLSTNSLLSVFVAKTGLRKTRSFKQLFLQSIAERSRLVDRSI